MLAYRRARKRLLKESHDDPALVGVLHGRIRMGPVGMGRRRRSRLCFWVAVTGVCVSSGHLAARADVLRFDFESGDLQGWRIVEGRFDRLVCAKEMFRNEPHVTCNKQGRYFLTTLELANGHGDDKMTGVVESPVFVLNGPNMTMLVGGGNHPDTYVALCTTDGVEHAIGRGTNSEKMQRITWDTPSLVGQRVFLRVVDRSVAGWGHITFDDFRASGQIDKAATAEHFDKATALLRTLDVRRELKNRLEHASLEPLRKAVEDLVATFGDRYARGAEFRNRLGMLQPRLTAIAHGLDAEDEGALRRALEILNDFECLRREALLANPLVRESPILCVARKQYPFDHHNTETMFQTAEINTHLFAGGGAIKTVDLARGHEVKSLIEVPEGIARDPEVHFSGKKIVFSMRRNKDDDYHIYEMNTDGTGLRQLTSAGGVSDIDPFYLPDDSIVFSSSREPKYCMCNRHIMANLYRMDPDGANIHQIGKSTLFEGHGTVMPDGRILYDRWEYVDRNFGDAQALWTANPDGTNHTLFWGNHTACPGAVIDARMIRGSDTAVCLLASCHDKPWGAMAVIDRRLGLDGREPIVRTWPAEAVSLVRIEGTDLFDTFTRVLPKYEDPYPLSDLVTGAGSGKYFLCSRMTGNGEEMGLYLVDVFGNETLLHKDGPGCFDPMPLSPRPRPPVIPSRRDFEGKEGRFYVVDVYQGTHMKGVQRGTVRYLRVVESPEKRFWTRPSWNGQGQEAPAMGWHDFNNKRILGTVPVEADGSAYFSVPADTFVYFQLLDESGMMIQSMRSGTNVQSGETTGCMGCHEDRRTSAPARPGRMPQAMTRTASRLEGWYGAPRLFSFMAEVQPVFDRHCVNCHDFGKKPGEKLNLAGDRTLTFNTSYEELWRKKYITAIGAGPAQFQDAYAWGSHGSKLVETLRKRPECNRLDSESFDRIVTWIDINAPYYPTYASAYPNNLAGRSPLDDNQIKRLTELTGIPFASLADHSKNRGPEISFDRPELSACLSRLGDKNDLRYKEALRIIQEGREALSRRPRGDTEDFEACDLDRQRQEKYAMRHRVELKNREAIRTGTRLYEARR